ncbi:hypothetical protein MAIT1_02738 [Magnetofaba australis IT-1]|uniref:Uncharacterized protein n=2 Tax=Magnetofaba TaxID=1472292 RepID=A0A1Y2K3D6_9PROT|nr:hypothetical protein MAIT1_02738 [Magnetofaba australis IT-1]
MGCRFYDPASYNECAEPVAERVVEKEDSTFCDWFKPRRPSLKDAMGGSARPDPKAEARAAREAAEALFKK